MVDQEKDSDVVVKGSIAQNIIRKYHRTPIAFYRLKDLYVDVTTNPNFLDSLLVIASLIAFSAAFPFYPFIILGLLVIALFIVTLRHAFLGLIVLMLLIFPMLMYQTPALAYVFVIVMTIGLVFGYRHYRTFIFALILIPLAFSTLGYLFAIVTVIVGVLTLGYKRASVLVLITVLAIVMISGVTGIQNKNYIFYNAGIANQKVSNQVTIDYSIPNKVPPNVLTFGNAIGTVSNNLANQQIVGFIYAEFGALFSTLIVQPLQYIIDLIAIIALVTFMDMAAVGSRSFYKGTEASLIGAFYPIIYIGMSIFFKVPYTIVFPWVGFIIAVAFIYVLELYRVDVVKALEVRKEDLRLKFGEAFEDLLASNPNEKYSDIGDYEATKKELKEAIISPIEEKGISRAYNIRPVKGVLLFGPPGTGKTLLMRVIANDIHAGFFLVKTPDLVSAYPGETERRLANIFVTAKKNAPCILFFDEIDSISRNRNSANVDEVHRQILSELLVEMDGFQKLKNVVVVGATNVPNLIDPALLRPGRIDKVIYMPLPDFNGRREIFKIYLKKLPISKNIDYDALAKMSERFSGADIKVLCENIAQQIAQEAANKHKVLEITQEDIKNAISSRKPSTTLAQVKEYDKFRIDFERRTLSQERVEKSKTVSMDEVIGLDDVKKAVVDAVKTPMEHPELVKKYNVKGIKGILMFGPPGNGKTMLMRAISTEFKNVTMLDISGADLAEQDLDKALAGIKEVFNRAVENAPSRSFIDEVDGIAPNRKNASEAGMKMTSEFLQEMDGLKETPGVVLICATNRPSSLDPAILRPGRFDKLIFVEPPNEANRELLFKNYMQDCPINEDVDYKQLGKETEGFTGADISNVCREAKSNALSEEVRTGKEAEITMEILSGLIVKFKPSAPDKLVKSYQAFLDKYGQR